jgi:excinuclease ABC subunit B
MTESMARALGETRRRREMQITFNTEHGIEPRSIRKEVRDILSLVGAPPEGVVEALRAEKIPREIALAMAADIERKMREAAANLEFEKAGVLRDELIALRRQIGGNESLLFAGKAPKVFQHALRELIGS